MDKHRAKEIAASPIMANVTYNGVPIYIEKVDTKSETATVYPLDEPENEQEVSVKALVEH